MKTWIPALIGGAVCALVAGCGGEQGAEPESQADSGGSGQLTLINRTPVVYQGEGDVFAMALIDDGAFSALDLEALPTSNPGAGEWFGGGDGFSEGLVQRADGGGGGIAFGAPEGDGEAVLTQETPSLGGAAAGAWVIGSMRARAEDPMDVGLLLRYPGSSGDIHVGEGHPGGGAWQDVTIRHRLPNDAPPNLAFQVARRGGNEGSVEVESVTARLERPTEAETEGALLGRNLLENASLTERAWIGSYAPWRFSSWGAIGGVEPTLGLDPAHETQGSAVVFPPPDEGGIMLWQSSGGIDESVRETTLRAVVEGRASTENVLAIQLRFSIDGEEYEISATHSGSGEWEEIELTHTIPADAHPGSVRFDLFRRAGGDEPSYARDAVLEFVDD